MNYHQFRFVFAAFYVTAVLIFTVYIRGANDHVYYKISKHRVEQNRLKQQIVNKQLLLENLINPAAVSESLSGEQKAEDR